MKAIVTVLALFPALLNAEGLPKDENGNLDCPHLTMTLNESQIEEVETLDSVTLTKEQWRTVRQTSPNTPKRLEGILPITHNDCTCGQSYSAVLLSKKKLALFIEEQTPEILGYYLRNQKNLTLRVDHRGQFYLGGILTRFSNLVSALEQSQSAPTRDTNDNQWVQIGHASIETPLFMSPNSSVYSERISQIMEILEAKGWTVYGMAVYALKETE